MVLALAGDSTTTSVLGIGDGDLYRSVGASSGVAQPLMNAWCFKKLMNSMASEPNSPGRVGDYDPFEGQSQDQPLETARQET